METCPCVGRLSVARMRSSVVLPAPFGPTMVTNSPGRTIQIEAAQGHERAELFGQGVSNDQ